MRGLGAGFGIHIGTLKGNNQGSIGHSRAPHAIRTGGPDLNRLIFI
jgi:hypothetical protein